MFKYLLDDEKVARLVLSALLGKEVLELQFRPTEVRHEAPRGDDTQLLVLRMDFAATVRLEGGARKLVLIEIQKARSASDVQRFRRYLGSNYTSAENDYLDVATGAEVRITDPLVEALTHDAMVVQMNRLKDRLIADLQRRLSRS